MADARDPWWVIGSMAVAIHGYTTVVADVDLLLTEADAPRVLERLGIAVAPGIADDRFRSTIFARHTGSPLPIEFMAGLHVKREGEWQPVQPADREGRGDVFVPSRTELAAILRAFGRPKDLARASLLEGVTP